MGTGNDSGNDDAVFDSDVERQWDEANSIRGVDPDLLDEQAPGPRPGGAPAEQPAAFSPWLIPFSAILTGPLVAAFLALFADGEPPSARQAIAIVSTGFAAWVVNIGFASTTSQTLSADVEMMIRLGVLAVSGMALWAMYIFWMKGRQALDRRGLTTSAIILIVLSGIFWFGRAVEPIWWGWLGR